MVKVKPPVKVYGSLYGHYIDLMRFFDTWKYPSDEVGGGDIDRFDYVFLGNYCDRGAYNLETLCLLLALKAKHPEEVHMLRGAHEDIQMNSVYGLMDECRERLNEDTSDTNSVF